MELVRTILGALVALVGVRVPVTLIALISALAGTWTYGYSARIGHINYC